MSIRTISLALRPPPTQSMTLEVLRDAFAAACNHISAVAWQEQEFHRVALQHLVYHDVRALYGLKAQHTIRAIAVVADSYKVDDSTQHRFCSDGAVPFDTPRLYQLRGTQVRLSTCGARVAVDVRLSKYHAQILASSPTLAEADLVQDRKGRWRFLISAHFPDAPQHSCSHTLGVDLGRRDIAHTSNDAAWNGGPVQARRDHYAKVRRSMQKRAARGTLLLARTGDYTAAPSGVFDDATRAALDAYMGRENLEERAADGDVIDAEVLRYMRSRSP